MAQTPPGQHWLGQALAAALSSPDFVVEIDGLRGIVPFRIKIARIDIGDGSGTYLTLRNIAVRISPATLLSGRVRVRSLIVAEINMARMPSLSGSSHPLAYYLRVPRLPTAVTLERLAIGRLVLAEPVLGDNVVSTIIGEARIVGDTARASFDLHRIDGRAGRIALAMAITGSPPVLTLHLAAGEPTGLVVDRLLGRRDHLPLALALDGMGPLADWHGLLTASAGAAASLNARLGIAAGAETELGLSGTAGLTGLLPGELAPFLGEPLRLALHARLGRDSARGRLKIDAKAGTLTADGVLQKPDGAIAAHLRAEAPDLSPLSALLRVKLDGAGWLQASLTGSEAKPNLTANLAVTEARIDGAGAAKVEVQLSAVPRGILGAPRTLIDVTASGRLHGLVLPKAAVLPSELGRDLDFSLAGSITGSGAAIELGRMSAHGMGLDVTGAGRVAGSEMSGRLELSAADLRPFGGLLGHPLAGSAGLTLTAANQPAGGFSATLEGSIRDLQTGIGGADALLGGMLTMTGAFAQSSDGALTLQETEIDGAKARLSANGRFDPSSRRLDAVLSLDVPRLDPLGKALGARISGGAGIRLGATGTLDRLAVNGEFDGRDITAAGMALGRVRLAGQIPDLASPRAVIDGSFGPRGLDGTLALRAFLEDADIVVPEARLSAGGGEVKGGFRIGRDTGLVAGRITGRVPDFARWSKLVAEPLHGSFQFAADLDPSDGQRLNFTAAGTNLSSDAGSSRFRIGRLDASVRLAGIRRTPTVAGRLAATQVHLGVARLATAKLTVETPTLGHFAFAGDVKGQPLTAGFAGEGQMMPTGAELRLNRLVGSFGEDRFALHGPLVLSRRGSDMAVSGLDLTLGHGRISGSGQLRGERVRLAVDGTNLAIAPAVRALGYRGIKGELSASARIGGSLGAPQGHLAVSARDLDLSARAGPGGLGFAIEGDWNGRELAARGRVTGLKGDNIAFDGALPLRLSRAPLGISVPADGRLRLDLRGKGQIANLADLLPLGEDRVAGRFAAEISVAGTLANPSATGHLRLIDARWENFASGAVLTNIEADLAGDRDRFRLASFTAADNAAGRLEARGGMVLNRPPGPVVELSAKLAHFRIAARDEANVTASGTVTVSGSIGSPKVSGRLSIDKGEINLPQGSPTSVARLDVVVVDSKRGAKSRPPPPPSSSPALLSAALDLRLDAPGPIFVRGHGLDSQWRGKLTIRGTSAAPDITGRLEQIQGSFDLLGKTFQLTRGTIVFGGGAKLDPSLDIVAEATAADITARIVVTGPASAPKIALSSTPALPQDEILARVLFGQSVGRISAAQGLQLAQAAATLAGGGPGVLDKLRGKLGLDWLRLGEGPSGPASSILNPALANPTGTSNAAVSAGKYLMPGVSVGVTQGVSPPTSKVTVQIEVRPHVTVQGEAGQSGSTGIGLNYQYDY